MILKNTSLLLSVTLMLRCSTGAAGASLGADSDMVDYVLEPRRKKGVRRRENVSFWSHQPRRFGKAYRILRAAEQCHLPRYRKIKKQTQIKRRRGLTFAANFTEQKRDRKRARKAEQEEEEKSERERRSAGRWKAADPTDCRTIVVADNQQITCSGRSSTSCSLLFLSYSVH